MKRTETMKRTDPTRRTPLKSSRSSVQEMKTTKNYDDPEALSTVPRSVSMNAG